MIEFDVENIELDGQNLIEASAGTGKTHSIAILVLRLLLEKQVPIEKILMVTFTNAAVAELEIRIRDFIRTAAKLTGTYTEISDDDNQDKDDSIKKIVYRNIRKSGLKKVEKLLQTALLFLDESSIFTIHSFCQITLSDFAFETGMLFNNEIIENEGNLIEQVVNDFWRKEIATLDDDVLSVLFDAKFDRKLVLKTIKEISEGKTLYIQNPIADKDIKNFVLSEKSVYDKANQEIDEYVESNWNDIKSREKKSHSLKKFIRNDDITGFTKAYKSKFFEKNQSQFIRTNFPELYELMSEFKNIQEQYNLAKTDILIYFLDKASQFALKEIKKRKHRNQMLTFYDLISNLHKEIVINKNTILKKKLRDKYSAVFIDEFQDTDNLQYEIFKHTFVEDGNKTIFFIGDPKQSIYAFRGADIYTYIEAKKDILRQYTMKFNYRSTQNMINGMNEFFSSASCQDERPNPFCTPEIQYENVYFANKNLGELKNQNIDEPAFEIQINTGKTNNANITFDATARRVLQILNENHFTKENKNTPVLPSNIAILVRNKKNAKEIKKQLTKYGIPSIIVDDTKVVNTDEALDLYYFLFAIVNNSTQNIKRALLTGFTGFTIGDLMDIDMEYHKSIFIKLQQTWLEGGIYSVILEFISVYGVRKHLLERDNENGSRIYTNLMQLTDILNEKETFNDYGPEKSVDWLKKAIEGDNDSSEYEQRIESERDAVQIATIHKSKGLAYDIVLLPDANFGITTKEYIIFNSDKKRIISYHKTDDQLEIYNREAEQENRRLLYVAITRAIYKCVIFYNNKQGTLNSFIENGLDTEWQYIKTMEYLQSKEDKDVEKWIPERSTAIDKKPLVFRGKIEDKWRLTSFSALDIHTHISKKETLKEEFENRYDAFVFGELSKGVQTGLILHSVLEKINFTYKENHKLIIENTLKYYGRQYSDSAIDNYLLLVENILETTLIPQKFKLKDIDNEKRFNELEFFYSFDNWQGQKIKEILPEIVVSSREIEGVMHGFIDLLFVHQNKFYILDWKTNHLGNNSKSYSFEKLKAAMEENNYFLQFYIYTIAAKRFLEKHIPDFDFNLNFGGVYYLFLRGIRMDKDTGIFFAKPQKDIIDRIENIIGK